MSVLKDVDEIDLIELKEELSKNGIVRCPVRGCSEDFRSFWGLKYHLKQSNHDSSSERTFNCQQCSLIFQSRTTLQQHLTAEHSGVKSGKPVSSSPNSKETEKRTNQAGSRNANGTMSSRRQKSKFNNDSMVNKTVSKTSAELKQGLHKSPFCSKKESKLTGSPMLIKGQQSKTPTCKDVSKRKQNDDNVPCHHLQGNLGASGFNEAISEAITASAPEDNMSCCKDKSLKVVLADKAVSKSSTELRKGLQELSLPTAKAKTKSTGPPQMTKEHQMETPVNVSIRRQTADNGALQISQTDSRTSSFIQAVSVAKTSSFFEADRSCSGVGPNKDLLVHEAFSKSSNELAKGLMESNLCHEKNNAKCTGRPENEKCQYAKMPKNATSRKQSAWGCSKTNQAVSVSNTKLSPDEMKFDQLENDFIDEIVSKTNTEATEGLQESSYSGDARKMRKRQQIPEGSSTKKQNSDDIACQNLQADLGTSSLNLAILSTKTKSSSEKEGKSLGDAVATTRTSKRVRTPRKTFYEEAIENKRASSISKRKGVKRKADSDDGSREERESVGLNKNAVDTSMKGAKRPNKKLSENERGVEPPVQSKREKKRMKVAKEAIVISAGDDENEDDDDKCDGKKKNKENDNDKPTGKATGRRSKEASSNGDQNRTAAEKRKGNKEHADSGTSELVRLKRELKTKKYLVCKNKGCGAKYWTAGGYLAHQKICGIKEEEREKFVCDLCGKEYTTRAGLAYHMKAKHAQSTESDLPEEKDKEVEESEVTESGRTRRKAASRALSRVHHLAAAHTSDKMQPSEGEPVKKKSEIKTSVLDQLLITTPGRVINKGLEDRWHEDLKLSKKIVCPCKGCQETFMSVASVKEHLQSCDKAISYKCLACSKIFGGQFCARNHVKHWHVGYTPGGKDESDTSDVDFELISSDESGDVEIEEIEETDSDFDEALDDAEEVFVWDDKRKQFKKTKPKKPVHKLTKLNTVGDVYTATEKWRQEFHKQKGLFTGLKPCMSYWLKVSVCEHNQYIPEATESPQFTIERKNEDSGRQQDIRLPLFGSTSKEDSVIYGDVTFNVGGPVWAMDWCPVPDSIESTDQFLAISAYRSLDQVHLVHNAFSNMGLIQLWNAGKLKADSASSGAKPTLSLGIAHNYGTIREISWCPSGTWESVSSKQYEDDLPRLGLMAVASSDGLVRILSIPWPSVLLSASEPEQNSNQSSCSSVIMHATPHVVLVPCSMGATYDGQCGQAWCVRWNPHSMHDKIAAGFSDGSVAIWNLSTESVLLKEPIAFEKRTFRLFPFLHISANSSVIRELAWCPQNPDIFVTGGYDRHYKLWNLKTPYLPITTFKRGIPTEIEWPQSFGSIVSSEEDCFQFGRCPNIVRKISFMDNNATLSHQNSTIWTLSLSDWSNFLACGDAAGEVVAVFLKSCSKNWPKFGIYRVYLERLRHDSTLPDVRSCNQLQEDTCGKKDQGTPELRHGTNMEDKRCLHTTKEVLQRHKLVFHDVNNVEFLNTINKSDPDVKRLTTPDTMQSVPCESWHNPQAIHKVRFNPNKQAFSWLASGGAAGLVRIHLIKQVT